VRLTRATLPVGLDELGHGREGRGGRPAAFEAETHQIHSEQARLPGCLAGEDHLVADRDPVLVDPVLEAPEPVRLRSEHGGRLRHLRQFHVLTADRAGGGMATMRKLDDALTLARRSIAVLGEQRDAIGGDLAERN
jgi:hypothetical protein